jgi:quercetin dioxygenase-like cupin family protein
MLQYKINFEKIEWETPIPGVRSKTYLNSNKQVRMIEYTKGMPLHWCEKGHYGLVLEGEMEIEYANQKIRYKKGDGIFIPDGAEHKHRGRVLSQSVHVVFVEDRVE